MNNLCRLLVITIFIFTLKDRLKNTVVSIGIFSILIQVPTIYAHARVYELFRHKNCSSGQHYYDNYKKRRRNEEFRKKYRVLRSSNTQLKSGTDFWHTNDVSKRYFIIYDYFAIRAK